MEILLRQGDITKQPDIAIVNAANTELWLGPGVAGAILDRGGEEIELEAIRQAPIALGQAVATSAGRLPNKYVIHAAAMGYRPEDQAVPERANSASSEAIIGEATANSLELATNLGCRSIAFPALATGVAGLPVNECARAMIRAVREYAVKHPESAIERVIFVLFRPSDYTEFREALGAGREA